MVSRLDHIGCHSQAESIDICAELACLEIFEMLPNKVCFSKMIPCSLGGGRNYFTNWGPTEIFLALVIVKFQFVSIKVENIWIEKTLEFW